MDTPAQKALFLWDDVAALPELQRLSFALDHLPDEDILCTLERMRGHGRNDFPVRTLWRAMVAGLVFQHPSAASLLRELQRNPALLKLCGFAALPRQSGPVVQLRRDAAGQLRAESVGRPMLSGVPTEWAFSRFLRSVATLERRRGLVSALVPKLRTALMAGLPNYGGCLGADGKALQSHSTGRTLKGQPKGTCSDPDAAWGVHAHQGVDRRTGKPWERIKRWFGYTLHLIADTHYGMPVAFTMEPANFSEHKALPRDLAALFADAPHPAERCRSFSADKGHDQAKLKRALLDEHGIRPLIDARNLWREEWDALPKPQGLPKMRPLHKDRVDNVLHTEKGAVWRRCPETGLRRPMAFQGYEADRQSLKCRCPAAAYDLDCAGRAACSRMAGAAPQGFGRTLRINLKQADRRIFLPTPHGSPSWRRGYGKRSALERLNARLDNDFRFERRTLRGKARLTARAGLALAIMMAMALGSIRANAPERMRSLIGSPTYAA